jgi:hypothetical protein
MHAIVGPILVKEGCYAFDLWTAEEGLSRGYAYRRIEEAHYARNAEIKSRRRGGSGAAVTCGTLDEFILAVTEREATFRVLVTNLEVGPLSPTDPPERHRRIPIEVVQDQ